MELLPESGSQLAAETALLAQLALLSASGVLCTSFVIQQRTRDGLEQPDHLALFRQSMIRVA